MNSNMQSDKPPNDQLSEQTVFTTPLAASMGSTTASMFSNSQNTYIANGSFVITTNHIAQEQRIQSLNMLYRRAAPNAILNAGGRADEVGCHPGTREEVISNIEKWRDAQDDQAQPILWLSGPAGAGKTAIMQTVAERCKAQDLPQVNFFFFRTDASRNSLSPFIATLVHQIILLYPPTRDLVATVLSINPLILDSVLDDQLLQLIVAPLQAVQRSSLSYTPPLIIVDGLDECVSKEKRSQQQILRAFDKVLMAHSRPFHLLVASRDESQIRAAFNEISTQLFPLYLNDEYSPERDIRLFVNEQFKRVLKMHPLSHTLDEAWPSVQDVEDIVKKSSGQFIYAATVMRFILDSAASPSLSLARVLGAAPISNKSPFSYLDGVYAYILSQVDDQATLKDILRCQLLKQASSGTRSNATLWETLTIYNPKYTKAMVHSCLANLTPIIEYTDDFKLTFYHASCPDYLLDETRSGSYFMDIDALNFIIQPAVWRALGRPRTDSGLFGDWRGLRSLAHLGVIRLRQLPPDFLKLLVTVDPSFFDSSDPVVRTSEIFKQLSNLCSCSDDVSNYRRILQQWASTQYFRYDGPDVSEWPARERRYIAMACAERAVTKSAPLGWIWQALRPTAEPDVLEVNLWLDNLLHRIHTEKYPTRIQEYNQLLRKWTYWATQNNVPLNGVDNLPNARWFCATAEIEHNLTIDIAFHQEGYFKISETAALIAILLRRIHAMKYPSGIREYNQLVRHWTYWAVQHDIPLDGVDDLPNTRWYYAMAKIERNVMTDIALHREEDCDVSETAAWLTILLRRIHAQKYPIRVQEYNQLLRKWMTWSAQNDVPLDGVEDLPNARWYRAMINIERNVMINIPLRREEGCDILETATWITILLCRIHVEKYPTRIQEYNYLLRKWTYWAAQNDIPLEGVNDLPNARWYRAMADIERNIATNIGLYRENECDVSETATWVTLLLYRIYDEKYSSSIENYNQLLRKWLLWAALNDIPLAGVVDLPNARWYCAMANIECDITADVALHQEQDCDVPETAAWLANLLRRIHKEMYHNNLEEYNRHLRKWLSWATSNDIPVNRVGDLPNAWWFLQQSRIEKWGARYFGFGSRSG